MSEPHWTQESLKALKAGAKAKLYKDPRGNNLSLKIEATGTKSWIWRGRVDGDLADIHLGTFPATKLSEARHLSGQIIADRAEGIDILTKYRPEEKRRARVRTALVPKEPPAPEVMTFGKAWDIYIEALTLSDKNRPNTIKDKEGCYRRYLKEDLADSPLSDVTFEDLDDIVEALKTDGKAPSARTTAAYLRAFYRWATTKGRRVTKITANIAYALVLEPGRARTRVLNEDEIRWLWRVLDTEETDWRDGYMLLLLSLCRRSEVFSSLRREVLPYDRCWVIEADRSKNGEPHLLPLGPMGWEIIERRNRGNSQFLFPSNNPDNDDTSLSGFSKAHARILAAMQALADEEKPGTIIPRWTMHDLRRTGRTGMAAMHDRNHNPVIAEIVIEAVINHLRPRSNNSMKKVYNLHEYRKEKHAALVKWEKRVMTIVGRS